MTKMTKNSFSSLWGISKRGRVARLIVTDRDNCEYTNPLLVRQMYEVFGDV